MSEYATTISTETTTGETETTTSATTTEPVLFAKGDADCDGDADVQDAALVLDFAALDYLSSAGLRVLLAAQKQMNKQGDMVVRSVNETIAEIFEVTGFGDILTIE